ncbi:MAG: hypothetical protein A4S08_07825 [Proteobacteria bacterium SG_bin4]|nr:MAG: hypothetical protein A4S08_07825 [Proteobacteria bacterium SG_bin4]
MILTSAQIKQARKTPLHRSFLLFGFFLMQFSTKAFSFDWSITELHYQYGRLKQPFLQQQEADTSVVTFQHINGWRYGNNFLFFDTLMPHQGKMDYYGEYYGSLSLSKLSGIDLAIGPIKDFGLLMGVNWAPTPGVLKYLPGLRVSWDFPSFTFLNADITAYIDYSDRAVKENNSFMIDINGQYPFKLFKANFSIEGHAEYIGERRNQFGQVHAWFFSQIQVRYDIGELLLKQSKKVFIGTEWQYWSHKLGSNVEENVAQALLVWRM